MEAKASENFQRWPLHLKNTKCIPHRCTFIKKRLSICHRSSIVWPYVLQGVKVHSQLYRLNRYHYHNHHHHLNHHHLNHQHHHHHHHLSQHHHQHHRHHLHQWHRNSVSHHYCCHASVLTEIISGVVNKKWKDRI